MQTFALIGGDGAGKTTIAKKLALSSQIHTKYLYMGLSYRSSNYSLPTSRLILLIKRYLYRTTQRKLGKIPSTDIPPDELEYSHTKRNMIWRIARFLNRLAETVYRQGISLGYQLQGYNVVFDRYYLFDIAPRLTRSGEYERQPWDMSLLHWIMSHVFPKPGLVFFLDAPADVLFERKREATYEFLERQRESFIDQGKKLKYFVRVDATQSVDAVQEQVTQSILEFLESTRSHRSKDGR